MMNLDRSILLALVAMLVGPFHSTSALQKSVEESPNIVGLAELGDGQTMVLASERPAEGFEHFGVGVAKSVSMFPMDDRIGSLRLVGEPQAVVFHPDQQNVVFRFLDIGKRRTDGRMIGACLLSRGDTYLAFLSDSGSFGTGKNIVAPYLPHYDRGSFGSSSAIPGGIDQSFSGITGFDVSEDIHGLAAFVSCSELEIPVGEGASRDPAAYPSGFIDGFVIRVSLEGEAYGESITGQIIASGSGPRLSRARAGEGPMMLTRARDGDTPSSLILWTQGSDGVWAEQCLSQISQSISESYDLAVTGTSVYVAALCYPTYPGMGILRPEEAAQSELRVWELRRETNRWYKLVIPQPDPFADQPASTRAWQVHLFREDRQASPARAMMVYGPSRKVLQLCDLDVLPREPLAE